MTDPKYRTPPPTWDDLALLALRFPRHTLVTLRGFKRPRRVAGHGTVDNRTRLGLSLSTDLQPPDEGWGERSDSLATVYADDVDVYLDPKWSPPEKDRAVRRADPTTHRTNANLEHMRGLRGLFLTADFAALEAPAPPPLPNLGTVTK